MQTAGGPELSFDSSRVKSLVRTERHGDNLKRNELATAHWADLLAVSIEKGIISVVETVASRRRRLYIRVIYRLQGEGN